MADVSVAERMADAVDQAEGRTALYFRADGRRMMPGGRKFTDGASYEPGSAAFVIHYPFRPSLASCSDMVVQFGDSGEQVTYDEARWNVDPRVDEQIGPSICEDWAFEELLRQRVAA